MLPYERGKYNPKMDFSEKVAVIWKSMCKILQENLRNLHYFSIWLKYSNVIGKIWHKYRFVIGEFGKIMDENGNFYANCPKK